MGSCSKQGPTRRAVRICTGAGRLAAALLIGFCANTAICVDGANQLALKSVHQGAQGARRSLVQVPTCPPSGLGPLQNLDLANFISAPWYAQAMQPTFYQPATTLFCFQTVYKPTDSTDLLKPILIEDYSNLYNVNGKALSSGGVGNLQYEIAARVLNASEPAAWATGPYFPYPNLNITGHVLVDVPDPIPLDPARDVPLSTLGSTWVVAAGPSQPGAADFKGYQWAIVSAGPPTTASDGACRTGSGNSFIERWQTKNIGLSLVSRIPYDPGNLRLMAAVAQQLGYDTSVLQVVQQAGCVYAGAP